MKDNTIKKCFIKKEDTVYVNSGKDKGKTGRVLKVDTVKYRAIVENVNLVKRHKKARKQGEQGGIMQVEAPIHISNLNLFCRKCNTGRRFGYKVSVDDRGKKVKIRYCKKCNENL